ncbi:MAG: type II toxin-antitoxin system Phd/YefM family antitoxin [Acidobacteriota bacterium]|nr:type II toxin-antitoxin system Phd/YefM family antitoxin [Acidobacteriota bacterium]
MSINPAEDIHPISELRKAPEKLLELTRETGRPVVITVEGRSSGVLVDTDSYQRLVKAFNMARALLPAEEDVKHGRVRPVFKRRRC